MIDILKKYEKPVPRYTSYPTAPHFSNIAEVLEYKEFLSGIEKNQNISLYVHIPFCKQLCSYCGCNTKIVSNSRVISDYVELIKQELKVLDKYMGRRHNVSHIHFGGGTPNYVATDDIKSLIYNISHVFSLSDNTEIAMELDPRLITPEKAQDLVDVGINRISIGVQDFDLEVQKAINRVQPYKIIKSTVNLFRQLNIKSINFDMIYGLPNQTEKTMLKNIELLQSLKPDRVSLFGYAHVPWFKPHQKKLEEFYLPNMEERFNLSELARKKLIEYGYVAIGIDHFALPSDDLSIAFRNRKLSRNFQGYTTDSEKVLIGLGQSSISSYGNIYTQNTLKNIEYRERVESEALPIVKIKKLNNKDIFVRSVIEQIMCYGEVNLEKINNANDLANKIWEQSINNLQPYIDDKIITVKNKSLKINNNMHLWARLVASCFDTYLNSEDKKHSRAI